MNGCQLVRGLTISNFIQLLLIVLTSLPLRVMAAESWEPLEYNPATQRMILIRGIVDVDDARTLVAFNVLDGYHPYTADLGYSRPASARTRSVVYWCGSKEAQISHVRIRDEENKLFVDEDYKPNEKIITLQSDDVVRRAALYACGDKSQKVGTIKHATPKDAIVLVCKTDITGRENSYIVSESTKTVDGKKAEFTPNTIKYRAASSGEIYTMEINRYSGQYETVSSGDKKFILTGKCVKHDKKQF